ncbi:hypothetical protein D3C84_978170 [compost metagenome]
MPVGPLVGLVLLHTVVSELFLESGNPPGGRLRMNGLCYLRHPNYYAVHVTNPVLVQLINQDTLAAKKEFAPGRDLIFSLSF